MTLLKEKAVELDVELENAVDAIRLSGELLVETGCATQEYTEAMIEGYERVGPYIVIAPGIAIPHSRPDNGALQSGFSLIRLKQPISFGHEKNDPVKLVCAISGIGDNGHIEMLQKIAMVLGDKDKFNKIMHAKDYDELSKIITISE